MFRSRRDQEFSEFVVSWRPSLLRTAWLLTGGDAHRSEDLVQTALAKVYVAWPRIQRRGHDAAYARRAVVTAFLDDARRPWRRESSASELPDLPDPVDAFAAADGRVDGHRVREALRALPPGMRAVVVLRHWHDLGVEETADLLGCTRGTVKSQNAKALQRLREALGEAPDAERRHPAAVGTALRPPLRAERRGSPGSPVSLSTESIERTIR